MVKYLQFENGEWPSKDKSKYTKLSLTYEGGDALEAFYYLAVDLFSKRGYKVLKTTDWYSMTERSQEWGSQQMKLHHQMTDASTMMRYINEMLKSYVAMKKDHQRITESLEYYGKEGKEPDELVLKGIWVDFVDSKTGAASLAQTTKNLEMFAVRDWFFRIKNPEKVDEVLKDSNARIRNYLKRKLREYETWKKHWRKSLMEFEKVLNDRIKTNKRTIDLYKQWTKPLLHNINALQMGPSQKAEGFQELRMNPLLLKVSNNLLSEVKLKAFKVDTKTWMGKYSIAGRQTTPERIPYVGVIEIDISVYASVPAGQSRTDLNMRTKVYESWKFKELYESWHKDEVEELFKELMLDEEFTDKVEKEIKEENMEESNLAFVSLYNSLKSHFKSEKKKSKDNNAPPTLSFSDRLFGKQRFGANILAKETMDVMWFVYDTLKKAFCSLSWPEDDKQWTIGYLFR